MDGCNFTDMIENMLVDTFDGCSPQVGMAGSEFLGSQVTGSSRKEAGKPYLPHFRTSPVNLEITGEWLMCLKVPQDDMSSPETKAQNSPCVTDQCEGW